MTEIPTCDIPSRVGRKLLWPDKIVAALPKGSLVRIEAALTEGEAKTDFIRQAIEAELKRRARQKT